MSFKDFLVGATAGWVVTSIALYYCGLFNGGTIGMGTAILVGWVCYAIGRNNEPS